MRINDKMVKTYLFGENCLQFKNEWYFTTSQLAAESGANIFTLPVYESSLANLEKVHRTVTLFSRSFKPLNQSVLQMLFPRFSYVLNQVQIDLIVGMPAAVDAKAQIDPYGQAVILADVGNIAAVRGYRDIDMLLFEVFTREFCRLLLWDRFPGLTNIPGEKTGYIDQLDRGTFVEGFTGLFSYMGIEIEQIQWDAPWILKQHTQSLVLMRKALLETEENRQKRYLTEAFSNTHGTKFASICGMMFLAKIWKEEGSAALMRHLTGGWRGFAVKSIS